jgi:hypothetical protein
LEITASTSRPVFASTIERMLLPRPEIRMTPVFTLDDDRLRRVASVPRHDRPTSYASRRSRPARRVFPSRRLRDHQHHADAAVERAVHLRLVDVPYFFSHWKILLRGQLASSSFALTSAGSTRGMFSVSPPPVMCATPFTFTFAIAASTGFT